jgi:HK97 family phage major capsid protein/HK97 family phage prohead protease
MGITDMPLPTPHKGESEQDFISRCMGDPVMLADFKDQSHRAAVCYSQWRDSNKAAPALQRAYAMLTVKTISDEQRKIYGTATTPTPDRMGDIVEPLGVKFADELPLLWQHDTEKPVGIAKFAKPTKAGIEFEAQIAKSDEPGTLKNRLDEAWQSLKLGLVKAVSIGFRAIDYDWLKETDGIHFKETEVLELSLVTIPAQAEATIHVIRSIDAPLLAASGLKAADIARPSRPGVAGKTNAHKGAIKMPKTIAEQISAFEATRAAKSARMAELMDKAAETGTTLDAEQSTEYDELAADVGAVDKHLTRLRDLEKTNRAAARPIPDADKNGDGIGDHRAVRVTTSKPAVPLGTAITRYVQALAYGKGDSRKALNWAKQSYVMDSTPEVFEVLNACDGDIRALMEMQMHTRAAIAPGTTTDSTWASPLVTYQVMADQLIELLRPATIIGRIPGLRRVPFNIQMPATTSGTTVGWVGEAAPKPVSSMAFSTVTLRWAKAAGIVVLTDELVRFSNPAAESVVRGDLVAAMAQFLDRQFVDPTVAAVTNVSPASITNGVTPVTPTGTNAAAFFTDVRTLINAMLTNNLSIGSGVFIMTQQQALALSLMQNALGQQVFPGMTGQGGTLMGYPVVASENVPATGGSPADGYPIIFALANEILYADDGQTIIDASNQASVQMDTAPDSPPTGTTVLTSLWQMNMTGVRAERWVNWLKRRSTAVGYIQNGKYA